MEQRKADGRSLATSTISRLSRVADATLSRRIAGRFFRVDIRRQCDENPASEREWRSQGEFSKFNGNKIFVRASGPKSIDGKLAGIIARAVPRAQAGCKLIMKSVQPLKIRQMLWIFWVE